MKTTKKLWLGTTPCYVQAYRKEVPCNVYATIEWDGKKLSIQGSYADGGGQINMSYREGQLPIKPAPGWTEEMIEAFFAAWSEWHLNDTRADTPEMKAAGWQELARKPVLGYEFKLTSAASAEQRKIKEAAEKALLKGEAVQYTPEQLAMMSLHYSYKQWLYPDEPAPEPRQHYERATCFDGPNKGGVKPPERKTLGWLHPTEHYKRYTCEDVHPDGLLGRKLGEHGYGSKWYFHEVPAEVIAFLMSLPDRPADVPVYTA